MQDGKCCFRGMTIKHKSGKQLVAPDALLRIQVRGNQTEQAPDIHMELEERGDKKLRS